MGKKTAAFAENQFVFAKVKGYSPWPAKITKVIQKNRYGVYFYGTGETASVKTEDLDLYDGKKAKYNTERQMKKADYQQAVSQIEAAIEGNDPAPDTTMEFDQNASELTIDGNDTTMLDDTSSSIPAPEDTTMNEEPPATPEVPKTPPQPAVVATPPPPAPQPVSTPRPEPVASPTSEPAAVASSEKKSRSGRTIKEKKINEDEMDPDEMFTHPKKRAKIDSESKSHKTPSANNHQTTASFNEFRASKMHILQDPMKKSRLQRQFEMIQSIQEIKNALGLDTTDAERAVELLEEFKESILPQINEVILLKYPNTVDTIRRLRKYIGNVSSWNLDEIQVEKFEEKAAKVRVLANEIFDAFKKFFDFNEDPAPFWNKFADRQRKFNEKYNSLDPEEIFEGLSEEDLDTLLSSKTTNSTENDTQTATTS